METKPIFNLFFTYEEALEKAREFKAANKDENGNDYYLWEDPRGFYNGQLKFRLDGINRQYWHELAEDYTFGHIDEEAKAALLWLIDRHKGFNGLELNQVIVGTVVKGLGGDKEVAIFTYLSRENDCLRAFITEKGYELTSK